jgi:hypothetical protein
MKAIIESIREIEANQETLRKRPYGVIEVAKGQFVRVQLRPWPKYASLLEVHWLQAMKSKRHGQDVCRLFYNQPMGHRNFLTLAYVESSLNTQLKTIYRALDVLTQIAFIKQSDAILAEVTNKRISDRLLIRRGWERHMEQKRQRHWIKRFYGTYPESAKAFMRNMVSNESVSEQNEAIGNASTEWQDHRAPIANVADSNGQDSVIDAVARSSRSS